MKMNNEELNTALYQKMEREQDKYRKWLVQCPPEEIPMLMSMLCARIF